MVESKTVMQQPKIEIKPPLSVIDSLTGGFETTTAHLLAIFFPLALDLFLWLGPRLSINPITKKFVDLINQAPTADAGGAQNQQFVVETWSAVGARTNLFTLFSTWPVGVPSLMSAELPQGMPSGLPMTLSLDNGWIMMLLMIVFTLIGLLLGAVYYNFIASSLRDQPLSWQQMFTRSFINWLKFSLFTLIIIIFGAMVAIPFLLLTGILQLLSPTLAGLMMAVWGAAAMWLWVYIAFTVQAIVLKDRTVWGAMWDSVRVVQFNFPSVMGLYLIILILNWGLGYLWSLPPEDSWLTLAAIGGHAFVSTALVAAIFVFYKDRYRWWVEVRNQKTKG